MEVWENEKSCEGRMFSQLFRVLLNFHESVSIANSNGKNILFVSFIKLVLCFYRVTETRF